MSKLITLNGMETITVDTTKNIAKLTLSNSNMCFFKEWFTLPNLEKKKDLIFYNDVNYSIIGLGGVMVGSIKIYLGDNNDSNNVSLVFDRILNSSNNSQIRSLNRIKIIGSIDE